MAGERPNHDGRVVVTLAFDSGYIAPASALIRTCISTNGGEYLAFEVIHDESISADDRRTLAEMAAHDGAEMNFHLVDEELLGGLPVIQRFTPIVWSRLFLPEILAERSRALYLDCDVVVLCSLRPLWDSDLGSAALGAVANVVEPAAREHVARLGIRYPGGFFNSGVILFDLDRMRAEGSTERLVEFALSHREELVWPDQDTLNAVFEGKWHSLHPRWNAQNSLWSWSGWAGEVFGTESVEEAVSDPAIRHFEGPTVAKPWHYMCPAPHADVYRAALAQTPWASQPLLGRTVSTRMMKLLPKRWRLEIYGRWASLRRSTRFCLPD